VIPALPAAGWFATLAPRRDHKTLAQGKAAAAAALGKAPTTPTPSLSPALLFVRILARRDDLPRARAECPVRSADFQSALVTRTSANERCHCELRSLLSLDAQSRLETGAPFWLRLCSAATASAQKLCGTA